MLWSYLPGPGLYHIYSHWPTLPNPAVDMAWTLALFWYPVVAMCGIFGYVGTRDPVPIIMGGLRSLEYRGYDSAGIAVVDGGKLQVRRSSGKLKNLEELLTQQPLNGHFGVGHTRWATHGRPTEENAHPHRDCKGQ